MFYMILAICIIHIFICTTRKDGFKCLHFPMLSQQEQPTYPILSWIKRNEELLVDYPSEFFFFFLYLSQGGWTQERAPHAHIRENVSINRTLLLSSQILIYFIVGQNFKQRKGQQVGERKQNQTEQTIFQMPSWTIFALLVVGILISMYTRNGL